MHIQLYKTKGSAISLWKKFDKNSPKLILDTISLI